MPYERIDKILSTQGICTRSEAKKLIRKGNVEINGIKCLKSDEKCDPEGDIITFMGERINYKKFVYIMMNKPAGIISASSDGKTKTVIDILPQRLQRNGLFPAGRLDKDTEGLLIITDDGDFAHRMLSPVKKVYKRYYARTDKAITDDMIKQFGDGLILYDGIKCLPAGLERADKGCFVTVCEGKFHQVKKMLATVGVNVVYLKRLSIGSLELDPDLKEGESRELFEYEKNMVFINKKQE